MCGCVQAIKPGSLRKETKQTHSPPMCLFCMRGCVLTCFRLCLEEVEGRHARSPNSSGRAIVVRPWLQLYSSRTLFLVCVPRPQTPILLLLMHDIPGIGFVFLTKTGLCLRNPPLSLILCGLMSWSSCQGPWPGLHGSDAAALLLLAPMH